MLKRRRVTGRVRGAIALVFAGFLVVPYIWLSLAASAQPWSKPFDGWVTILQSAEHRYEGQLELRTVGTDVANDGSNPQMQYSVIACGSGSFDGKLLIGGDARLENPSVEGNLALPARDYVTIGSGPEPPVKTISLQLNDDLGRTIDLGEVQTVDLHIDPWSHCGEWGSRGELQFGLANVVEGRARNATFRDHQRLGLPSGTTTVVWPLVGGLPGIPGGQLGVFHGSGELPGDWQIPSALRKHVSVGNLLIDSVVETAVPALVDTSELQWQSERPIQPSVRLKHIPTTLQLQGWLTWAAIGLGIGGSILASAIFEWIRAPQPTGDPERRGEEDGSDRQQSPSLTPTVLVAVLAYLVGRLRR